MINLEAIKQIALNQLNVIELELKNIPNKGNANNMLKKCKQNILNNDINLQSDLESLLNEVSRNKQ